MEKFVTQFVANVDQLCILLANIVGVIGIAMIVFGVIVALAVFFQKHEHESRRFARTRIILGQYLVLGLEFLVGKDIMESIVDPSWDDLGKLILIIVIRTAVSVFLFWELRHIHEEQKVSPVKRGIRKVRRLLAGR